MATRDDTSKPPRSRRNQPKTPAARDSTTQSVAAPPAAPLSTTPPAAAHTAPPPTTQPRTLEQTIEHERGMLLQIRAMLHCLYEVLLYGDDDDTIMHAEVAETAARLINDSCVRLDAVNLQPLIDAIRNRSSGARSEDESDFRRHAPYQVREPRPVYLA